MSAYDHLDKEQWAKIRRCAKDEGSVHAKIALAYKANKGCRLTAEEVDRLLTVDDAFGRVMLQMLFPDNP